MLNYTTQINLARIEVEGDVALFHILDDKEGTKVIKIPLNEFFDSLEEVEYYIVDHISDLMYSDEYVGNEFEYYAQEMWNDGIDTTCEFDKMKDWLWNKYLPNRNFEGLAHAYRNFEMKQLNCFFDDKGKCYYYTSNLFESEDAEELY